MMKRIIVLSLSLSFALSILKADYWTQKADFSGPLRTAAFSFSIDNKGYMGTGRDAAINYYVDFWEYDPALNSWTQKADFGGNARMLGIGFSIAGKGYAGMGGVIGTIAFNDLWEYDPVTNIWSQKANFGGGGRMYPVAFSIGNYGYVGTGTDNAWGAYYNDFWQYNPVTDTWIVKAPVPGTLRADAVGFSIGNNGYIGTGYSSTGNLQDFWKYNPTINIWTQIADFPMTRIDASAFSICKKGFVGVGNDGGFYADIFQYDTTSNQWIQKANFSGISRDLAISFSIGLKGYVGVGWVDGGTYYSDFWQYTPDSIECTTGVDEIGTGNLQFSVSPNPANEFIIISSEFASKEKIEIKISDAQGKKVFYTHLEAKTLNFKLQTSNYSSGIYFVELTNGKEKTIKKFLEQ